MSLAVAGHGATWAMELSLLTPGVFTTIAELNSDLMGLSLSRPVTPVTPHQDTIDSKVTGVLQRQPLTLTVNYVHGDSTHAALRAALLAATPALRRRGFLFRGPGWSVPGTDEIIASGEVTAFEETNPVVEGPRSAQVTIEFSKAMIIDGVSYGSAA